MVDALFDEFEHAYEPHRDHNLTHQRQHKYVKEVKQATGNKKNIQNKYKHEAADHRNMLYMLIECQRHTMSSYFPLWSVVARNE